MGPSWRRWELMHGLTSRTEKPPASPVEVHALFTSSVSPRRHPWGFCKFAHKWGESMRNGLCLCRLLAASGLPVIRALSELCGGRLVTVATLQAQVERVNAQWPMFVPFARRVFWCSDACKEGRCSNACKEGTSTPGIAGIRSSHNCIACIRPPLAA